MYTNSNNWHVTEDEDIVPVRQAKEMKSVSRRPAAISGILVATLLGALFIHDANEITAQVTEDSALIVITATGLQPVVISAAPGETITWKNEQEIPHYLISDSLCTVQNECMTTSTMFTGDETSYTIPSSTQPGAYTYFSPTDPNLVGTISIEGEVDPIPAVSPSVLPPATATCYSTSDCSAPEHCSILDDGIIPGTCVQGLALQEPETSTTEPTEPVENNPLLDAIQKQLDLDKQTGTASKQQGGTPTNTNAIPGIAQNPYTVEGGGNVPLQAGSQSLYANIQKPFRQPNTGPGIWVTFIIGFITIFAVCRRSVGETVHRAQ